MTDESDYACCIELHALQDQNRTLRAELDNLRGKLTALADGWDRDHEGSEWIAALDWGADALRAIVRGSDDEATP